MKVALLTDTHWGTRSDNVFFLDNIKTFLDKVFFPVLDKQKIKRVIHLGDIVDRRKYINFLTAYRLRKDFIEPLQERGISLDIILGNHDIYYKQAIDVNAFDELLNNFDHIKKYTTATEVKLGQLPVLYIPWLCDQNIKKSMEAINNSKSQVVMGHLEFNGFEMFKGVFSDHGISPKVFQRFDYVFTGHYHHKSSYNNIHYLGAPCEFIWSDFNDPRGFHIFDTRSLELDFIRNPYTVFEKVYYDDAGKEAKEILDFDFSVVKNKYIKIIVKSKTNTTLFDEYSLRLEEQNPQKIDIVDDHLNLDLITDQSILTEAKDTLTIFREYIAQANGIVNSERLDNFIVGLYQEAQNAE